MKINIQELLPIQEEVNDTVLEKLNRNISIDEFILAFNTELFEYFNEIGTWKWWKHSHEIKKEEVLEELADCFAFFLSIVLRADEIQEAQNKEKISPEYEKEIQDTIDLLLKDQEKEPVESIKLINNWILMVGCDHETENRVFTVQRFSIAIFIAIQLFEDITWDEITEAYKKKSEINIERQNGGY